ncbi:MAG: glucosamine-6-phosphate deaminase [Rhodothermales bacterium]
MLVDTVADYETLSEKGAEKVAHLIHSKPDAVIGFATGSTPVGLYQRLVQLHENDGLDFSGITTFNLDEYIGLSADHVQSYSYFMWRHLFSHINVTSAKVHLPDGMCDDIDAHCAWYEEQIVAAGGLDMQILGIGANGHLAFNEPGSSLGSRTRIKTLTTETVHSNARFFDTADQVPKYAITMGVGTIMEARKLLLLASGSGKAAAIKATLEGPVTAMVPATIVQLHRDAHTIIDEMAASQLDYHHHDGIAELKPKH